MASRELPPPRLPNPPVDYDQITTVTLGRYIIDLVRSLETFMIQEMNPGQMRGTKLTLTAIPTSAVGLEVGELYRVEEQVKVVVANIAAPDGESGTGGVGSVTVVIS